MKYTQYLESHSYRYNQMVRREWMKSKSWNCVYWLNDSFGAMPITCSGVVVGFLLIELKGRKCVSNSVKKGWNTHHVIFDPKLV